MQVKAKSGSQTVLYINTDNIIVKNDRELGIQIKAQDPVFKFYYYYWAEFGAIVQRNRF